MPKGVLRNGIFFRINLILNSAASKDNANMLSNWYIHVLKTGEAIKKILRVAIALMITKMDAVIDSTTTSILD